MSIEQNEFVPRHYPDGCCTSPYLSGFVEDLSSSGYTPITISNYQRGILHLGRWADSVGIPVDCFDEGILDRFRGHLKQCRCTAYNLGKLKPARLASVLFLDYLRREGVVPPAQLSSIQKPALITDFRKWMDIHKGMAPVTIDTYEDALTCFFSELGLDPKSWSVGAIRSFVLKRAEQGGRSEIKRLANAIRALLQFLAFRGHWKFGWEGIVPPIPQWRLSSLPRYLEPEVVDRVISACDRSTPNGLRDRAVLLLLARLGLRGGDIVNMKICDIDWKKGRLRLYGKQKRETLLPLPQEVGDAILDYIEKSRPKVDLQSMFLCIQAPYRPFGRSSSIGAIVKKALQRAGVKNAPWQGAHLLRHSAATAMIREGCTLEAVATVLRHKSIDTTAHYAKVDIRMLQTVMQPWPEGTQC